MKKKTTRRPRDAASTRAAILAAARRAFSGAGYDSVGVRDIAAGAGVTAALVNRYFGSKKSLFAEAVLEEKGIGELLTGDRRTAGARLAAMMLDKDPHGKGGGDPLLAILRSAPDPEAAGVVREWLQKVMVGPIAKWLGGPDAETRASVMVSTLLGFIILRQAIGLPGLSASRGNMLREMMSAALQSQIDASALPR
jgi:AcrR family transcriptional regulator